MRMLVNSEFLVDFLYITYYHIDKKKGAQSVDKKWNAAILSDGVGQATRSPKLSIPQQIEDMKKRGIAFEICTEAEARKFLSENNYYFKLKAYAHNFDRYRDTEKKGQYINLDFAHLKDLSTIDARLRKLILSMSIDLEHFLKVRMLNHFNMVDEDGYQIIEELFRRNPDLKSEVEGKINTSTCNGIVKKHHGNWAIWNVIELMSFGQFINLYELFYQRNSFEDSERYLLYPVKMLRNAAAHNNCLINQMRAPYSRSISVSYDLRSEVRRLSSNRKDAVVKYLSHPTIHDFIALLVLYNKIVPDPTKSKGMDELELFFAERIPRHSDYYKKQQGLVATYNFVYEIIKMFTKSD